MGAGHYNTTRYATGKEVRSAENDAAQGRPTDQQPIIGSMVDSQ